MAKLLAVEFSTIPLANFCSVTEVPFGQLQFQLPEFEEFGGLVDLVKGEDMLNV